MGRKGGRKHGLRDRRKLRVNGGHYAFMPFRNSRPTFYLPVINKRGAQATTVQTECWQPHCRLKVTEAASYPSGQESQDTCKCHFIRTYEMVHVPACM